MPLHLFFIVSPFHSIGICCFWNIVIWLQVRLNFKLIFAKLMLVSGLLTRTRVRLVVWILRKRLINFTAIFKSTVNNAGLFIKFIKALWGAHRILAQWSVHLNWVPFLLFGSFAPADCLIRHFATSIYALKVDVVLLSSWIVLRIRGSLLFILHFKTY